MKQFQTLLILLAIFIFIVGCVQPELIPVQPEPDLNCEDYHYSTCPEECVADCIGSCQTCQDCDGSGSCRTPTECANAGEQMRYYDTYLPNSCCEELDPMLTYNPTDCHEPFIGDIQTCSDCGNGICESENQENDCSCPVDCKEDYVNLGTVSIWVDKESYNQDETVKITVQNSSDETIYYFSGCIDEITPYIFYEEFSKKYPSPYFDPGQFIPRTLYGAYCDAEPSLVPLNSGQALFFVWTQKAVHPYIDDQNIISSDIMRFPGLYKIGIDYLDTPNYEQHNQKQTVFSQEFELLAGT